MRLIKHFHLVLKHKFLVMIYCFKLHLYFQGIVHDLSKFSWTEIKSCRYYQGHRSPILIERQKLSFSPSFLHHSGRNKHHFEYWIDLVDEGILITKMPYKYVVEMICDMISASKTYNKSSWCESFQIDYINRHYDKYKYMMHPDSFAFILEVFTTLKNTSLKTILKSKYLKQVYAKHQNFPMSVIVLYQNIISTNDDKQNN